MGSGAASGRRGGQGGHGGHCNCGAAAIGGREAAVRLRRCSSAEFCAEGKPPRRCNAATRSAVTATASRGSARPADRLCRNIEIFGRFDQAERGWRKRAPAAGGRPQPSRPRRTGGEGADRPKFQSILRICMSYYSMLLSLWHFPRALSRAYRRLKKEYNDNRHDRIMQEQVRHDRAAIPGRTLAIRYAGTAGD